ncbi:MAG: hypothetical protein H6713_03590 [Myxococcales bacterium]|nr:hypothetical protein [Myxococcales bacterium]
MRPASTRTPRPLLARALPTVALAVVTALSAACASRSPARCPPCASAPLSPEPQTADALALSLPLLPAWSLKYVGTPSADTPRLDIDAVIARHGLRRDQAVELQNHFFDLRRAAPTAEPQSQFDAALQRAREDRFEDRRDLKSLREREFIVVFDLDDTLYDQYRASADCHDLVVEPPGGAPRYIKFAPGWDAAIRQIHKLGGAVALFSANLDDNVLQNTGAWRLDNTPLRDHPSVAGVLSNSHLVQQSAAPLIQGDKRRAPIMEASKDLRIFDPTLTRVIIVDDNPIRLFQFRNTRVTKKFHADRYCQGDAQERAAHDQVLPTVVRELEESITYARANKVDFATAYLPYSALGQLTARALIDGGLAPADAIDRIRRQPELVEDSY